MRRNTTKMHTFYTADVQEAPRGTQGTQEAAGGLGSKKMTKPLKSHVFFCVLSDPSYRIHVFFLCSEQSVL